MRKLRWGFAASIAVLCGCKANSGPPTEAAGVSFIALEFEGPPGSRWPSLTPTNSGGALLTWLQPGSGDTATLAITELAGGRWSPAATVTIHDRFFINWADFPSGVEAGPGNWVVHWLERTAERPYAYHVMLSRSSDRGITWTPAIRAHQDNSPTEHGFVTMNGQSNGSVDLVWLDGQEMMGKDGGPMQLRSGTIDPDQKLMPEVVLDGMTCECCQARLISTSWGKVAAFRDRSTEEVRDIGMVRQENGVWDQPTLVAQEGWVHRACPVNGPALVSSNDSVGVAWYTEADATPRVQFAWSGDRGHTFAPPIRIDQGNPIGRTEAAIAADGSALVVWLEGIDSETAEWRLRKINGDGSLDAPITLTTTAGNRRAGFARITRQGPDLLVAITSAAETPVVKVFRVRNP